MRLESLALSVFSPPPTHVNVDEALIHKLISEIDVARQMLMQLLLRDFQSTYQPQIVYPCFRQSAQYLNTKTFFLGLRSKQFESMC